MNETHPCGQPCGLPCADACALQPPALPAPVVLEEALGRFGREAVRGTCDTGHYRMPYYSWGEGPPLLFVHGVADSSRSFLLPVARLSAHFRCVAYDLPVGKADGANLRGYSHADLVRDFWALLDHLGLRQSYVFGSSFGSTVTLAALHERPQRLPRAVLQGGLAHRVLRPRERLLARLARWLPGPMGRVPFRTKMLRKTAYAAFAGRPDAVWRYFLDSCGEPPITAFAHQVLMLERLDMRPLLPAIRQPVLLVCGEHDRVVPRAYSDVLLEGLPNAGRVVIEGCGHVPSYTHPEALAEVVRRFLTPGQMG
jgi:pimeloyl-ACP methyl ester carboxylesterase